MRERVTLDATATIGMTTSTSFRDVLSLLATLAWFCFQLRIGPLTDPRINLAAAMMVDFCRVASCQLLAQPGITARTPECPLL
jgi:hypothetical protein